MTMKWYGSWNHLVERHVESLEQSVITALGDYVESYDVDGIINAYGEAIHDALPPLVSFCGDLFVGPADIDHAEEFEGYPLNEYGKLDIRKIVQSVDFWKIAEKFSKNSE